jgi:hypothetical protein
MSNLVPFYVVGFMIGIVGIIATYFLIKIAVQHGVEAALSNKTMVRPEKSTEPVVPETSESTSTYGDYIIVIVGIALLLFVLYLYNIYGFHS